MESKAVLEAVARKVRNIPIQAYGSADLESRVGGGAVNSKRESERLLGYFGELGELLLWFAARPLA